MMTFKEMQDYAIQHWGFEDSRTIELFELIEDDAHIGPDTIYEFFHMVIEIEKGEGGWF